jgi:hypothetical protein
MMSTKHFAALIGFAFVAAWISFNLGYAILCLVGAAAFYALAGVVEGEIDLGEVQQSLRRSAPGQRSAPSAAPPKRRVQ